MKKATEKPTRLVTKDEWVEGLKARIKELEEKQQKGGMNVPKMKDTARKLRKARATLLQLQTPPKKPKKRRVMTEAAYSEKLKALGVVRDKG